MATKRGLCPYCKINNIQHSIFLVNPEASSVFCGTNMHQISPQEAIKNYERYMQGLIKKADDTLNVVCNPALAYQEYADVIEIDNSYVRPYLGRLLCLVYMSKVRKNHLHEAKLLLEVGTEETFTKVSDFPVVFNALRNIVKVTEEYLGALKKKLTFRQYFYDTDCLKLYCLHINEILKFKDLLLEETKVIVKKAKKQDAEVLHEILEHNIEEKNILLKETDHITVDGKHYRFVKVRRNGEVEIEDVTKRKTNTFASRYRMATLNPDDKKLRYIKDLIFKDYTTIIASINRSLVFLILLAVILVASAALVGIFFTQKNIPYYVGIVLGMAAAVSFVTLLIVRLTWKRMVMKRKMEIY